MKQNNNIPLLLGIAIAFGIMLGSFLNIKNVGKVYDAPQIETKNKLNSILKYIDNQYVDEVNVDEITEEVIGDLLKKLDPHSSYLPKDVQQYTKETMNGNFVGIGVQFAVKKDTVVVLKVLPEGPSLKAGLRAGDRLLMADKDTIYGKKIDSDFVVSKLKGKENSQVLVKVHRPGEKKLIDFNITRGKVPIKSVPVSFKIKEDLGYIKIERFALTTYDEFKKALDELQSEGIENLVLDLRENPGGYMHIAHQIADEFLSDGKMIVYTKNKKGRQKNSVATTKGSFEKGHVYVLVDEHSASASEIVSGALQDNDKGTIIGRRTYGKGLVQQEVGFKDGSAMRLTIARYYTPTGRCIQKSYDTENYDNEVESRYNSGELFYRDSIKVIDSLKYKTPKGKIVYGGGGITPDVFVPLDTLNTANYYQINRLHNFVYNYVDTHRKELEKYTEANFIESFKITPEIKKEFQNYLGKHKMASPKKATVFLKESFANALTTDKVYYKLLQQRDTFIDKVKMLETSENN